MVGAQGGGEGGSWDPHQMTWAEIDAISNQNNDLLDYTTNYWLL